jgi:hypothetical protein
VPKSSSFSTVVGSGVAVATAVIQDEKLRSYRPSSSRIHQ